MPVGARNFNQSDGRVSLNRRPSRVNRIPPRSWTARDQYFEKLGGGDIAQEIENGKIKSEEMANGLTAEKHGSGSPSTMSITVEISVRVLKPNRKNDPAAYNVDLRSSKPLSFVPSRWMLTRLLRFCILTGLIRTCL